MTKRTAKSVKAVTAWARAYDSGEICHVYPPYRTEESCRRSCAMYGPGQSLIRVEIRPVERRGKRG